MRTILVATTILLSSLLQTTLAVDTYPDGAYPYVVNDPGKSGKQPGFIFLHGSGACGSDLTQLPYYDGVGSLLKSSSEGSDTVKEDMVSILPLHPSCSTAVRDWDATKVNTIVQEAVSKYNIDTDRLYCGGYSMGGKGTWLLAMAYPDLCKKMVISAGFSEISSKYNTLSSDDLAPLKDIPMRLLAGSKDDKQNAESTAEPVLKILQQLGAPDATLGIFAYTHTDMSKLPWQNDTLWDWVLESESTESSNSSLVASETDSTTPTASETPTVDPTTTPEAAATTTTPTSTEDSSEETPVESVPITTPSPTAVATETGSLTPRRKCTKTN